MLPKGSVMWWKRQNPIESIFYKCTHFTGTTTVPGPLLAELVSSRTLTSPDLLLASYPHGSCSRPALPTFFQKLLFVSCPLCNLPMSFFIFPLLPTPPETRPSLWWPTIPLPACVTQPAPTPQVRPYTRPPHTFCAHSLPHVTHSLCQLGLFIHGRGCVLRVSDAVPRPPLLFSALCNSHYHLVSPDSQALQAFVCRADLHCAKPLNHWSQIDLGLPVNNKKTKNKTKNPPGLK